MNGKRKHRPLRTRVLTAAVFLACLLAGVLAWRVRGKRDALSTTRRENPSPVRVDEDTDARIVAFCGDCHGMPRPDNYPRYAWRKEVQRGYEFYARSGRNDLAPPPMNLVITYFEKRAPAQQVFPEPAEAESELSVEFVIETLAANPSPNLSPAVSHLQWTRLDHDATPVLLACDMRQGTVLAMDPANRAAGSRVLANLNHPCHVEACDLDKDDAIDLVVADLGSLYGVDDLNHGRIVWLRRREEAGDYEEVVIASDLGRVCDVRPADIDVDGDIDLIVADFGAYRPGGILLLRNVSPDNGRVHFAPEVIDPRPGTVHAPVHDLNHDGRPDFVALVSQDHECVDAFINQPDGQFHVHTLWAGPDPAFGANGMELADLDQDGDMDVLYTNGDSFDDAFVKPCHGVHWLENQGDLQFAHHRLTHLPGAYCASAGDIDLDGDMDVIAAVWIEPQISFINSGVKRWDSLVCLEQTEPGRFVRHTLERDFPWHATIAMADFDGDGDLDLAAGSHARKPTLRLPHWLSIWWNQAKSPEESGK